MGYSREIYHQAQVELLRRRTQAEREAQRRREEVTAKQPRLAAIEREMARSSLGVAQAIVRGGDVEREVAALREDNLRLQAEREALLKAEGLSADGLEPHYTCPACEDTGYVGQRSCSCREALLRELAYRELNYAGRQELSSFDTFRLDYYADKPNAQGVVPRAKMAEIVQYCRCYADDFDTESPSLLLRGPTGLGKTHLSLAIARAAVTKGFGVVYGPVQRLLHRIEKEHFGREEGNSEDLMTYCDLLVLDDLGTEFNTPFSVSCLYNLINNRLLEGLPTIISTNLSPAELEERYDRQIVSRLHGEYQTLCFAGDDIRQVRRQENG